MEVPYKRVHVIINPAAGGNEPILNVINDVFRKYKVDWDASITHRAGDATRQAREAIASGVDLVAGYGGDGTQMEVMNGVIGSDTPMAILPGGTGNAMSFDLKIPHHLNEAAELICQSSQRRSVDVGRVEGQYFLLRAYTGLGDELGPSREMKDEYGLLAYPAAALTDMSHPQSALYHLTIDGEEIEADGLSCFVANVGTLGGINLPSPPDIDPSDGLLDVFLACKELHAVRAFASYVLNVGDKAKAGIRHWRGREIVVRADPPQDVAVDGEPSFGQTPVTIEVVPQAIQVVVP